MLHYYLSSPPTIAEWLAAGAMFVQIAQSFSMTCAERQMLEEILAAVGSVVEHRSKL
jgi:hypothetical protein